MKITIDGIEMVIDIEKAKELGLVKEETGKLEPERKKYKHYHYFCAKKEVGCWSDGDYPLEKMSDKHFENCNYFDTSEQAQLAADKTFDIWFKIRAWAIREGVLKEFELEGLNYYVYYNNYLEKWGFDYLSDINSAETFMSKEGAERLCKILNEGGYRP